MQRAKTNKCNNNAKSPEAAHEQRTESICTVLGRELLIVINPNS